MPSHLPPGPRTTGYPGTDASRLRTYGPVAATVLAPIQAAAAKPSWERGSAYFRRGQVLDVAVAPGVLTVYVVGSSNYKVTLRGPVVTGLAGDDQGLVLGDGRVADLVERTAADPFVLKADCTCPLAAYERYPCKHIVAGALACAEMFTESVAPFALWRGLAIGRPGGTEAAVRRPLRGNRARRTETSGPDSGPRGDMEAARAALADLATADPEAGRGLAELLQRWSDLAPLPVLILEAMPNLP